MILQRSLVVPEDYDWDKRLLTDAEIDEIRISNYERKIRVYQKRIRQEKDSLEFWRLRLVEICCMRITKLLNQAIRDRIICGTRNFIKEALDHDIAKKV